MNQQRSCVRQPAKVMPSILALLLALGLPSCSYPDSRTPVDTTHPKQQVIETVAHIADPALAELSGLASSRRNPGVLWAHNDSGDTPRLFALDSNGATIAKLKVEDAQAVDWEDIAIGPGPDGRSTLFIGDIGDNLKIRPEITVYRVLEPLAAAGDGVLSAPAESLDFTLPGGPRDAEGLMRDPLSNRLFVVSKESIELAIVFGADALAPARNKVEMEQVGEVKFGPVTAADISFDGMRIAFRTTEVVAEWVRDRNERVEQALSRPPARVLKVQDGNSEALAYSMNASIVLSSEGVRPAIQKIQPLVMFR